LKTILFFILAYEDQKFTLNFQYGGFEEEQDFSNRNINILVFLDLDKLYYKNKIHKEHSVFNKLP